MMDNRRTFIKKAALLAGATAAYQAMPSSIQRALAIEAPEGSTYLDAEHIVFLMQENRSFDHCYGTLKGVRGFNDPRALQLDNGLPVWLQTNAKEETFPPFRLDIENTKATWMGSLPHGWRDMVGARNDGKMDTWLEAKKAGNPDYQHMPLTMGYYARQDIPFYYAFADAFTVCDQHFCSSLTGTSANRSYFWAGTIREEPHNPESTAHVDNGQINYQDVRWTTYPERLQKAGIDWKVYQNELSLPVGLTPEEEDWLANFTDNNLEFHAQYNVRFHPAHRQYMAQEAHRLRETLNDNITDDEQQKIQERLSQLEKDMAYYTPENFEKLDPVAQDIHKRAFVTNTADPNYHRLETIHYQDHTGEKNVRVPQGDIFHQFREDVKSGNLPTVSWLVAPCRFSDHPGSPWYGAWYVSEALDILTANPDVWKKTIFILTYDENDGYFDHVPPFVPPHTARPNSGKTPQGMDTAAEYVTAELDSPIGLGFRVPLVVASPWTKGGWVNSEVFDHTSNLQFLEHFLEKKFSKKITESNISPWRRLICGDLTSVFRPIQKQSDVALTPVNRNAYVQRIYSARDKTVPNNFRPLDAEQIQSWRRGDANQSLLPLQEEGTKPACALPYDVEVNAHVDERAGELVVQFSVGGQLRAHKAIGVPFIALTYDSYKDGSRNRGVWNFAVCSQEPLTYSWKLNHFRDHRYRVDIHGPNGFYRSFQGPITPAVTNMGIVRQKQDKQMLSIDMRQSDGPHTIRDLSYGQGTLIKNTAQRRVVEIDLRKSYGWYDLEIRSLDDERQVYRYAGHLETGKSSMTDPLMGYGKVPQGS
ncbi:phospholipase C, phosphocholine-specific [Sphingobacterium sp. SGR-19]|nr:phospholipase C, phosphocholine-specific [Sphingobacterium sp. SGR-19]